VSTHTHTTPHRTAAHARALTVNVDRIVASVVRVEAAVVVVCHVRRFASS
jgi:hypothetical protein